MENKTELNKELMTVKEVAEYLKMSVLTIWKLIRLKEIPAIKIGQKSVRIKRSELENSLSKEYFKLKYKMTK